MSKHLTEEEFVQALIRAGWSEEDARREAFAQLHTDAGDCDGDLGL